MLVDQASFSQKIKCHQKKYKTWYDHKYGAKEVLWKEGEWVVVKKPARIATKLSKFYEPMQIDVVKKNVVRLRNGQWWSMDHLAKLRDHPLNAGVDLREATVSESDNVCVQQSGSVRPRRMMRLPVWRKDYV